MADLSTQLWDLGNKNRRYSYAIGILFILSVVFTNYLHILMMGWSFVAGLLMSYLIISNNPLLPNLLPMFRREQKVTSDVSDTPVQTIKVCSICGDEKCTRHRPELTITTLQPWANFYIPQRVDNAIAELLELVLKNFIYVWYHDLSSDEQFVTTLRQSLRYAVAVILKRAKKLDIPHLIIHKLIKAALSHFDSYMKGRKEGGEDIQQVTLDLMGQHLHCAMHSRKSELQYLRKMTEALLPHIFPRNALECKGVCALVREILSGSLLLQGMDVIADPDMVNKLLLIFFDEEPMTACTDAPSPKVCILEAFYETNHKPRNSALSLELTDMLKDKMILYHFMEFMKNEGSLNVLQFCLSALSLELTDMLKDKMILYHFMEFMKNEGSLNVLQFCLSVEDFNRRSLVPELSIDQMVCLHQEAQDLYRLYFAPHAIDRIQFEDDIIGEVKSIAEGPYKEVTRLRTSDALFRAYEHAYNLLENTFCPLFHQSDAYYTMLCGRRLSYDCRPLSPVSDLSPTTPSPPPSPPPPPPSAAQLQQRRRSNEPLSAVSKLGSRIKGVFKSQTVEERLLMEAEDMLESDSPQSVTDILGVEDILPLSFPLRDLSAWRVNILRCGLRQEGNNKYFVYVIHVDRLDVRTAGEEKMSWEVERRYHEFYVLENKLTEFHGVFEDCSLPSKRSFGTRTQDFIESKLPILEKWLQMLLTKPVLRGSELLYNFLTTKDEFVAKLLPDVNFGKMLKSVPNRLLKERGQFLEPFLQSFAASTEAPKPKPSGNDLRDKTYETLLEKRHSDIYDDNAEFNVDDDDEIQYTREITDVNVLDLDGAFEYVVYLARAAYEIPVWIHQILMTVKILAKNTIEGYLDYYMGYKLDLVLEEEKLEFIIHILRDAIFFDNDPPRTDEEKKERLEQTFVELKKFIPKIFSLAIGEDQFDSGSKVILDLLQYPKLNKQLSYVLLDIALLELFPELEERTTVNLQI